ncbi:MAG: PEP-CTERM sorting domain-containing protein [Proteobacteria bacterium]|nr:PEP-CTERM sorting domain-containing protein [Pseudomonadota bacterium]
MGFRQTIISVFMFGLVVLLSGRAEAVTMMIGDADGFGFTSTAGLLAASGVAADTDGDGILEAGEYLPDLNGDGNVATHSGDDFNYQSVAEAAATDGAEWTDISLSTSLQAFNIGPGLADDAQFTFDFTVPASGDVDYGVDHYINFVFGDYDVIPMTALVDGVEIGFTVQSGGDDGLVKVAYAVVSWADMLDGQVVIDIVAPNEPYVAFDYALLDTATIIDPPTGGGGDGGGEQVPEPSTLLLLGSGLAGLGYVRRKFRR